MPVRTCIDLTAPIRDRQPGVAIRSKYTIERDGWNATMLELYSHSGTHMDAPYHFGCGVQTIDRIPLERLRGPAWLVDLQPLEPKALIRPECLGNLPSRFRRGDALILRSGWFRHLDNQEVFRHGLPRVSEALAQWCVDVGVNLLGVEPPSVADVDNLEEVTRIHRILLGGDVIIVEGLAHLEKLTCERFEFAAYPLRIEGSDGSPCRAMAFVPEDESLERDRLAVHPARDRSATIREKLRDLNAVIAVLDDDPTGTQTVSDINVHLRWDRATLASEFGEGTGLFYLLTNSRALDEPEAIRLARETGTLLGEMAAEQDKRLLVVSRSDSTLRGHYPAEVDALIDGLGWRQPVPHVLAPFFEEGGRLTIHDVHYVAEGDRLIPAAQTPFAKDATFGFDHSNLRDWIVAKSKGRIRWGEIASVPAGAESVEIEEKARAIILNAVEENHLHAPILALLDAMQGGANFVFRTAAGFVRALSGQVKTPLLPGECLRRFDGTGGLFVVGSHVPKTTRQLERLLDGEGGSLQSLEIDVHRILENDSSPYLAELSTRLEAALAEDRHVIVYTSRQLATGADARESLRISLRIAKALVDLVAGLETPPRFLVAKGGITACELAREALGARSARVLGQALPGVPAWRLETGGKFPGLPYVVFPGNVGDDEALLTLYQKLVS